MCPFARLAAGRFNNIRMALEIVMVFAAATGRTLVLPPTQNLHLEEGDSTVDSFEQFYSFRDDEFRKRVQVISMKEFIELEGKEGLAALGDKDYARVMELTNFCHNRRKSEWREGGWHLCIVLCLRISPHVFRRHLLWRGLSENCRSFQNDGRSGRNGRFVGHLSCV